MSWPASLLIGALSALFGGVGTAFIAERSVRWYRITGFEGYSGYFVVFTTLGGIVAAFVIGVIVARVVATSSTPTFLRGLGTASGVIAGLLLVSGAAARLSADISPKIDGRPLELEIEVRSPPDHDLPAPDTEYEPFALVRLLKGRPQYTGRLRLEEAVHDDGRWTVPATVPLETSSRQKYVRAYFNRDVDLLFALPLAPHPQAEDTAWSGWQEAGWEVGTERPPDAQAFHMRYRVRIVPEPPPPPSAAEVQAASDAARQAAFDALPPDAPLAEWLPFTRYGVADAMRDSAVARMLRSPRFATDLAERVHSSHPETAAEALRLIALLPQPDPSLNPIVEQAGRDIAEAIRTFNASSPADDPSYQGAADVSIRFNGWLRAVESQRARAGGDFTPELRVILELSRVREDSYVMRTDVLRVASYYMHEWAGLAPLSSDPKPR